MRLKKNVFYAEIQLYIARFAKITLNVKNVLITQFGMKLIKNVSALIVIHILKTNNSQSIFYQNTQETLTFIVKLVSKDCLTVKNVKTTEHVKNIKNARMDSIDHNKHKNAQKFAKMIK